MTPATLPMTTKPAAPPALPCVQLPCPLCGEPAANVAVNLWTLDEPEGENFFCSECEGTFSVGHVRAFIRTWGRMLTWLESIPAPE